MDFSWETAVFLTMSGLRGAIGLALGVNIEGLTRVDNQNLVSILKIFIASASITLSRREAL